MHGRELWALHEQIFARKLTVEEAQGVKNLLRWQPWPNRYCPAATRWLLSVSIPMGLKV